MVFLARVLRESDKGTRRYARGFLDSLRLHLKAGAGGNGYPKFGGAGGRGGHIYVEANDKDTLFQTIRKYPSKRIAAPNGDNSNHMKILGEPGADVTVQVPAGVTLFRDNYDGKKMKKLGELNEVGSRVLAAHGGTPGTHKNGYFGRKGEQFTLVLDLRLIADVGLVGFPNAGKSTLLKAISRAKPKIAEYPFTTIRPNIATISYADRRTITMADLPGLIEGAHMNIGMGHQFLKHVERTKIILMIVDVGGFQLGPKYPYRSCFDTIVLLNKELELYRQELLDKPAVLVINKMDVTDSARLFDEVKQKLDNLQAALATYPDELRPKQMLKFDETICISAKENARDVERVKERLRRLLDVYADANSSENADRLDLKEAAAATTPVVV